MDSPSATFFSPRFLLRILPLLVLLLLGIWCSSGTLAPYALTLKGAQPSEPCAYLLNIDHGHFLGPYRLLNGSPRSTWEWSVVLRRMLYPLFAYPFMQKWGFEVGGFVANLFLFAATFVLFLSYFRRRFGEKSALVAAWLLATYPGITYWAGLPYSYVAIVPMSLLSGICLLELERTKSAWRSALCALGLGVAFTAYDLLPIFAPAAIFLLLAQRKWKALVMSIPGMLIPSLMMSWWLKAFYQVDFTNSNTTTYHTILNAYISFPALSAWWPIMAELPKIALHNFFASGFIFLPLLFLCFIGLRIRHRTELPELSLTERALLLSVALVFLFANAAPPYAGWQLRGMWIARLYQPIFIPILFYVARSYAEIESARLKRIAGGLIAVTVLLNLTVLFGPLTNWSIAEPVYYNFYRHSPRSTMTENIGQYGQRPLGFCSKIPFSKAHR